MDNGSALDALAMFAQIAQCSSEGGIELQIDIYTDLRCGIIEISLGNLPGLVGIHAQKAFSAQKEEFLRMTAKEYLTVLKCSGEKHAFLRDAAPHLHGQYIEIGFDSPSAHPHES